MKFLLEVELAQTVEHVTGSRKVLGSNPVLTNFFQISFLSSGKLLISQFRSLCLFCVTVLEVRSRF